MSRLEGRGSSLAGLIAAVVLHGNYDYVLFTQEDNTTFPLAYLLEVEGARPDLEIYDRVGGGDSFASGVAYGFLAGKTAAEAVEYGAAHGALAMTTPGDTTMASLAEVEKLVGGGSARVD